MLAISLLLDTIKPRNIVEFGTGVGGLSVLIGLWAKMNGANFRTYDKSDQRQRPDIFEALGIRFSEKDVFSHLDEIAGHIQQGGVTLVLCDDGDKPKEIETFAKYLKSGDFIMAHDFIQNDSTHDRIIPTYWSWRESSEKNGVDSGLTPVYQQLLEYTVWGCFRKE
jgi:cephalosporin hydroxylase